MSEWKNLRLTQVGILKRGKSRYRPRYAFHLYGGKYPFIQTGEIKAANKYINHFENTYSEAGLAQSRLWPKGTLCITIAANIAEIAILTFDACFPDSVLGFIPHNDKCDLDFVFYTLKHFQRELQVFGDGSVQDNINLGTFEQISFPFPEPTEQRVIASVLSSLDDKIDLLHRQNKTLESMAAAVFIYFFVDNRNTDWQECTVGKLAHHEKISIHPNRDPSTLFYHYSIPAFDETQMPIRELGSLIHSNKYKVMENTILFSKLNPHKDKRVWLIPSSIAENSVCSTEFQVMNPKDEKYLLFLCGFISHPENYDELAAGVGGTSSSHQRIDPEVIFKFSCFLPDDITLTNYNEMVKPIFAKIHRNRESMQTIMHLRDLLLPKLMSGEVRVKP